MIYRKSIGTIFSLMLVMLLGAETALAYEQTNVQNGGIITGEVKFNGKLPKLKRLKVTKDKKACGKFVKNEEIIISKGKMLKNVVISIANIEKGKSIPKQTSAIANDKCLYNPHVQAMAIGNYLEISNKDAVLHNTHGFLDSKTVFNLAMPLQGQKLKKKMKKEGVINVKCDAGHTWMNAYVVVFSHPYFAVTNKNGKFEIKDVPPGKYQLKAWHERLGVQSQEVDVTSGSKAKVVFDALKSHS